VEVVAPALLLAALVAVLVLRPLLAGEGEERQLSDRRADLEAAKEAKYREIRDAELDRGMGKLSEQDWRALDGELRAQAIEILRDLDRLEPGGR
jgi:membrane protein implicated in regulation of membrane protease activity